MHRFLCAAALCVLALPAAAAEVPPIQFVVDLPICDADDTHCQIVRETIVLLMMGETWVARTHLGQIPEVKESFTLNGKEVTGR